MTTVYSGAPTTDQPPVQDSTLSVQDLQNLLLIVDTAAQRGAFKAEELSQIGGVFDRVNQFVQRTISAMAPVQSEPKTIEPTLVQQPQLVQNAPPFAPKIGI